MSEQKNHDTPERKNPGTHPGATIEQSNSGGLGQPRGQGGQQLPGHETSRTGPGQYTPDQMTLGDMTDDSPGHHRPAGQEALPGHISRTSQQRTEPEDGQDGVVDQNEMWQSEGVGT